ncbi:MAG: glycosyltransferase family 2 protein [Armatimonadetes bacterium]|jgi:glycosyltransferase involved in cell wall biosynthesis|nr:glycosyltransferase family 2 protein [Armatimonadota bacterium]
MKLSVITCTRGRPGSVVGTVRSVLANDYADFEYLVVDQSDDGLSARAVRGAAGGDARLRYLRQSGRGKSRGLNFATQLAEGDAVALIDDDCEARADWLSTLAAELESGADIVCGRVVPAPHDGQAGYVTGFEPESAVLLRSHWCSVHHLGSGSNLAIRRHVLEQVGPFDELLGPGAPVAAGEDRDFLYRALQRRHVVKLSPRPIVVHNDFRPWDQFDGPNGRAASLAAASAYWKHIRRGDLVALWWYLADVVDDTRYAAGRIVRLKKPLGINRVRNLLAGAAVSLRYPVDRERGVYRL